VATALPHRASSQSVGENAKVSMNAGRRGALGAASEAAQTSHRSQVRKPMEPATRLRVSDGTDPFRIARVSSIWRSTMGRGLLLWLIGIPLPIILLIWLFGGLS
jgi:hypothetical protein